MVSKLFGERVTPRRGIDSGRQYECVVDLRYDVFEFKMGASKRLNSGEVSLREDEGARFLQFRTVR